MPDYQRRRKILVVVLAIVAVLYVSRGWSIWPWHHRHHAEFSIDTDKNDRSISTSTSTSDGGTTVTRTAVGDGNTKVQLALPGGFKADVNVPKRYVEGRNMDMDGVGMYPGATVGSVDVNASLEKDKTLVTMGFDAPAAPAAVADWFQQRLTDKGRTVTRSGDTLTGKTEEGKTFTIALSPNGKDSRGVMTIQGN